MGDLDGLGTLVNLMLNRSAGVNFRVRLIAMAIAIGGRKHQADSCIRCKKAIDKNKPVGLQPMSNWERRIVHMTLQSMDGVETRSVGQEPRRRVLVCPKPTAKVRKEGARRD